MSLALIAALPFLGALAVALAAGAGRSAMTLAAMAATATALAAIGLHAPAILDGMVIRTDIPWAPAFGLEASFALDGLGLLFAALILGIGLLIQLYARFYLAPRDSMAVFLVYLMLFQGAMLGIVLADNILLLLIFWELTSLSSFLLIGFWRDKAEARQGARMALAVTGAGGLAMIAGLLILADIAGSMNLSDIIAAGDTIRASDRYLPALLLILLGCFAKSAQFPFHFWLPHAMAAPTPVSAYLHSATMVKAGIFLLARLWPALSGTEAWTLLVSSAGLVTLLLGAKVALMKDDLKAILAYSTVSHLGLITLLLGLGTTKAAWVALFHLMNHAVFKAALFMTAGIVDHETGTRDIRRLGGLARAMPASFAITLVASLSMAGFPPLGGFLSKEMLLATAADTTWLGSDWLLGALVTAGALLSVAYSLRLLAGIFFGQPRDPAITAHDPGPGFLASPLLLAAGTVLIGLLPVATTGTLLTASGLAVTGADPGLKIALWHGLAEPALWLSLAAIGGGVLTLGLYTPARAAFDRMPKPAGKRVFEAAVAGLAGGSADLTARLHGASLTRMVIVAVVTMGAVTLGAFLTGAHLSGTRAMLVLPFGVAVAGAVMLAATIVVVALHHNRLLALILTGIVGLTLSAGFAYVSAPDLALTQLAVEVVTVLLMLIALNFLPAATPRETPLPRKLVDGALALAAGAGTAALAFLLMTRDAVFPLISDFHWAQSKPGAGGTNAVNTIIVDFRGYDTYGEIIVLGIAALVIFALTESLLSRPAMRERLRAMTLAEDAGDRHPMMLAVAARFLLPLALLVAVYLYLRGHNLPGGGFVAGLVVAIAVILQSMASGFAWTEARRRFDHHAIIGAGVLVASGAGIGAFAFGLPFLTSGYDYVSLWPLETFEVATAAIFDLGVFLCVLGAVTLSLGALSRLARASGEIANPTAFDIDPSRADTTRGRR